MPADRQRTALIVIRVLLAAIMFAHGTARISNGTVADFGGWLGTQGFPFGVPLAWSTTLFELVGSVLFAAGFRAWIIALLFVAQLATGIVLIHRHAGWFVVGAGRNGMELSVVLVVSFLAVAYADFGRKRT